MLQWEPSALNTAPECGRPRPQHSDRNRLETTAHRVAASALPRPKRAHSESHAPLFRGSLRLHVVGLGKRQTVTDRCWMKAVLVKSQNVRFRSADQSRAVRSDRNHVELPEIVSDENRFTADDR